jgi:hypothetical protein
MIRKFPHSSSSPSQHIPQHLILFPLNKIRNENISHIFKAFVVARGKEQQKFERSLKKAELGNCMTRLFIQNSKSYSVLE